MKLSTSTIFLLLFFSCLIKGQPFDLEWSDYQATEPLFSRDYIKKHKIRTVKITYQFKPANERIHSKNSKLFIDYNPEGLPERSIFITNTHLKPDTQITWFIYSSQNYLRIKRKYDKTGYHSEYFEHNPNGYLTKYSKVREQNLNKSPLFFKPGYQEIIWTESYKYEFYGKESFKRTCINDINQPYKQQVFNTNKNGNKISVYTTFVVTSTACEEEIKFNDKNQVIEKTYFTNAGNYLSERYTYEYKNDLVEKEYYFLNNKQSYERFYFYTENGLLESDLKKLPNENMDITKYEYEFY